MPGFLSRPAHRSVDARCCIDLLSSAPVSWLLGPTLARRAPLPVRIIRRVEELRSNAILVSDSQEISVEACRQLSIRGIEVVVLAMLPHATHERQYAEAGASAYLGMTVDDRLIAVLDALAINVRAGARIP